MQSLGSNSLSLKVSKVNTITRLQRFREITVLFKKNSLVQRLHWSVLCTVQHLYQSDVCTSPTFGLVRRLYCPTFVLVQRLYQSNVCTSPMFVLVQRLAWSVVCTSNVCTSPRFVLVQGLYQSNVCTSPTFVPVQRLYQSNVCTSPTFVPVQRLYQSDVCPGPTFVLSDVCKFQVCIVRRLWVQRLYWYR